MFNYSDFSTWADSVFENEFPNETIAINFNLSESTYSEKIKKYQGVGIGFVDGDIEIIYRGC